MKSLLHTVFVVSLMLAITTQLAAQDCNTAGRYTDNIFAGADTTQGLIYGRNSVKNYNTGQLS